MSSLSGRSFRQRLLPVAALACCPALASEWSHTVSLPSTVEHDSNLPLTPRNSRGVTRAILTPTYNLVGTFGIDEIRAGLGATIERSSDQRVSTDRKDPNLRLGWRRLTETGEVSLNYRYIEASSRATQLEETGAITGDGTQTTHSLAGSWRRALSARDTLTTSADYREVTFKGSTNTTNYANTGISVTYGHQWSERIEPFLMATASHYEPKSGIAPASENYTVQAGVNFKSSENLSWTAQAGMSRVDSTSSANDWLGSVTVRYAGQRHDFSLETGRAVTASGKEGGFVQSDYLKGTWSYALSELSQVGVDASWRDSKGTQPSVNTIAGVWASRELSPFWNARTYLTAKQRSTDGQPSAHGNVVGIAFTYSHPDF